MADTMIAYYSLEGNIDFVARELAKEIGADLFRIETVKAYPERGLAKFFHGGKDTVMGARPELKAPLPDLSAYSTVVLGMPVWAGRPAAPINTALAGADFSGRRVAAFASSAGGDTGKTFDIIERRLQGAELFATESFKNPLRDPDVAAEKIKAFAKKLGC